MSVPIQYFRRELNGLPGRNEGGHWWFDHDALGRLSDVDGSVLRNAAHPCGNGSRAVLNGGDESVDGYASHVGIVAGPGHHDTVYLRVIGVENLCGELNGLSNCGQV